MLQVNYFSYDQLSYGEPQQQQAVAGLDTAWGEPEPGQQQIAFLNIPNKFSFEPAAILRKLWE